jgi:acetyl esterase/lipase
MAANPGIDILSRRAMLDVMHELATEPADVSYQEILAAGQRALWVKPIGAAADRVILFLHGGGFIAGSINCHRKLAAHLAKATGCRALIPAYRLAPENPFPAHWTMRSGYTIGCSAKASILAISQRRGIPREGISRFQSA